MMMTPSQPHSQVDLTPLRINCSVITVSDTRNPKTDKSGQLIQQLLQDSNHQIQDYVILKDEPDEITKTVKNWGQRSDIDVIILTGGTGIAPRDTTYDSIEKLLEKNVTGFWGTVSIPQLSRNWFSRHGISGGCRNFSGKINLFFAGF
jgi:molybdenum cofactor biosynthesis protein B